VKGFAKAEIKAGKSMRFMDLDHMQLTDEQEKEIKTAAKRDEATNSVFVRPDGKYPEPKRQPIGILKKPSTEKSDSKGNKKPVSDDAIDKLTEQMGRMAINMQTMVSTVKTLAAAPAAAATAPAPTVSVPVGPTVMNPESNIRLPGYRPRGGGYLGNRGPPRSNYIDLDPDQCKYCFERDLDLRKCPRREAHVKEGLIHHDPHGKICFGGPGSEDIPIPFVKDDKSRADQIDAQKREKAVGSADYDVNVVFLGDPDADDSEVEYYDVHAIKGKKVGKSVPPLVTRQQKKRLEEGVAREAAAPALKTL